MDGGRTPWLETSRRRTTLLRVVQKTLVRDCYLCCALYWSTAFWIWAHAASGVRVPRTTES